MRRDVPAAVDLTNFVSIFDAICAFADDDRRNCLFGRQFCDRRHKRRPTSLGTNTAVKIYSTTGTLPQTILFHTSCYQPLKQNDQYGSLMLVGCAAPVNDCPAAADDAYNALKSTPLKV
jgi:hypothetical protein